MDWAINKTRMVGLAGLIVCIIGLGLTIALAFGSRGARPGTAVQAMPDEEGLLIWAPGCKQASWPLPKNGRLADAIRGKERSFTVVIANRNGEVYKTYGSPGILGYLETEEHLEVIVFFQPISDFDIKRAREFDPNATPAERKLADGIAKRLEQEKAVCYASHALLVQGPVGNPVKTERLDPVRVDVHVNGAEIDLYARRVGN
ncbi:MAG: hypothetical protein ACE15C_21200 [Phycisphaerae bacterium]